MDSIKGLSIDSTKQAEIDRLLDVGMLAEAIKVFRSYSGWGLKESKQFIDVYNTNRDVELTKKLISSETATSQFDIRQESYGDFLRRHTRNGDVVEKERKGQQEKSKKDQTQRQMTLVCQEIMQKSFQFAQQGKTQLKGVLRYPGQGATGSFIICTDIDQLQMIKANPENDYKTMFYTIDDAQYVKGLLEEQLNGLGIRNKVTIESQYYYYDSYKLKYGFWKSKTVKERHWSGNKNSFVVIFEVSW